MLRHSIPNASSILLKNMDISIVEFGSFSVPMVTTYRPVDLIWITILEFQSNYLNGVRKVT